MFLLADLVTCILSLFEDILWTMCSQQVAPLTTDFQIVLVIVADLLQCRSLYRSRSSLFALKIGN